MNNNSFYSTVSQAQPIMQMQMPGNNDVNRSFDFNNF